MIFATDLDRTLIYSNQFLEDFPEDVLNIEVYQEKPISYISKRALVLLQLLDEKATIIPITTRNVEQYHRIDVFRKYVKPTLYVVNNGGTIFFEGKEDQEWSAFIKEQLMRLSVSYEETLQIFLSLYKGPVERYKKSDELIWLVLGDEQHIDWQGIKAYEERMADSGWKVDVSGRKIYLYPACVNKWSALEYIKAKYIKDLVLAAGDSLFDYEMVHKADLGAVPKKSWIEAECEDQIYITQQEGLAAAEDLLNYALERV